MHVIKRAAWLLMTPVRLIKAVVRLVIRLVQLIKLVLQMIGLAIFAVVAVWAAVSLVFTVVVIAFHLLGWHVAPNVLGWHAGWLSGHGSPPVPAGLITLGAAIGALGLLGAIASDDSPEELVRRFAEQDYKRKVEEIQRQSY